MLGVFDYFLKSLESDLMKLYSVLKRSALASDDILAGITEITKKVTCGAHEHSFLLLSKLSLLFSFVLFKNVVILASDLKDELNLYFSFFK
jgi:hypothetical protein